VFEYLSKKAVIPIPLRFFTFLAYFMILINWSGNAQCSPSLSIWTAYPSWLL